MTMIKLRVTPEVVDWARAVEKERSKKYGHVFKGSPESRVAGYAGERMVAEYLAHLGVPVTWLFEDAVSGHDLIVGGRRVGVKCSPRCPVPDPRSNGSPGLVGINDSVMGRDTSEIFVFACYKWSKRDVLLPADLYIIGVCSKRRFMFESHPVKQGETDGDMTAYADMHNIHIAKLAAFDDLVDLVAR